MAIDTFSEALEQMREMTKNLYEAMEICGIDERAFAEMMGEAIEKGYLPAPHSLEETSGLISVFGLGMVIGVRAVQIQENGKLESIPTITDPVTKYN